MSQVYLGNENIIQDTATVSQENDLLSNILKGRKTRRKAASHEKDKEKKDIRICIWGSNKLDGQKSIWIQQAKKMHGMRANKDDSFDTRKLEFTWILTSKPELDKNGVVDALGKFENPIPVVMSPFEQIGINVEDFSEKPSMFIIFLINIS